MGVGMQGLRPAIALWAILGMPMAAGATTVLKLPLEEMARRADLVVRGKVREVRVAQDDQGLPTHTVVVLDVQEVMKGQPTSPVLRLALPGGQNAAGFRTVHGMPGFDPGEEVVLLLERTPTGWIPMGLSEGKFTVRRDLGDVPRALRRVDLLRLVPDSAGRPMHLEGGALDDDLTLDELRGAVIRAKGLQAGGAR